MKQLAAAFTTLMIAGVVDAQSYSHNYERFFGKDDRIGIYSKEAAERFSPHILKTIQHNTLLIDCGSSGKPSTAFIAKTDDGTRIISAAHNLTMAETIGQNCKLGKTKLPKGETSGNFEDTGMKDDAAYDIAYWPNTTTRTGLSICETVNTSANYILVQSLDGTGRLGISPACKIKSIDSNLVTTTCRGHYKASGAPLLEVSDNTICVAGVFNAHSGKRFNYESYAAKLKP